MTPVDSESRRFLDRYPSFLHRDEIAALVAAGAVLRMSDGSVPAAVLRSVYAHRVRNLDRVIQELRPRRDLDLERVLEDVRALLTGLGDATGDVVRFWMLKLEDGTDFSLFEAIQSGRVLGCVKARDQRIRPYDSMLR